MRTVFDDVEVVLLGDCHEGIHVTDDLSRMDGDDGAGSWRNGGLDGFGIDAPAFGFDVDDDG